MTSCLSYLCSFSVHAICRVRNGNINFVFTKFYSELSAVCGVYIFACLHALRMKNLVAKT